MSKTIWQELDQILKTFSTINSGVGLISLSMLSIIFTLDFTWMEDVYGMRSLCLSQELLVPRQTPKWLCHMSLNATVIHRIHQKRPFQCALSETSQIKSSIVLSGAEINLMHCLLILQQTWFLILITQNYSWDSLNKTILQADKLLHFNSSATLSDTNKQVPLITVLS